MQVEVGGQNGLELGGSPEIRGAFCAQSGEGEHEEGDEDAGHRGPQHEPDVGEEVGARHGRGEVGGVRKRGELVAEVGAGDDGAGRPAFTQAEGLPNADEGDTDRADRAPAGPRGEAHRGAQNASGGQEDVLAQDVQTDVDEGGNDAGDEPGSGEGPDQEQDEDGADGIAECVLDPRLEMGPGLAPGHAEGDRGPRGDEQGDLIASIAAVLSEGDDIRCQQEDEQQDGQDGHPEGGGGRGRRGHGVIVWGCPAGRQWRGWPAKWP